jgi:transcription antitermination factor NusA-like protein
MSRSRSRSRERYDSFSSNDDTSRSSNSSSSTTTTATTATTATMDTTATTATTATTDTTDTTTTTDTTGTKDNLDVEVQRIIKFLLPLDHVGAVIGVKGDHINQVSKISEVQKIVISKSSDPTYPKTRERIGMVVGTNKQLLIALSLILKAIHDSTNKKLGGGENGSQIPFILTILVPAKAAGAVIGKGGQTIKKLQSDSGARIILARHEQDISAITFERSIEITADDLQCVLQAVGGILEALDNGQHPSEYENKTVVYQHSNHFHGDPRGGGFDPRDPRGRHGDRTIDSGFGSRHDPRNGERDGYYDQRGGHGGYNNGGRHSDLFYEDRGVFDRRDHRDHHPRDSHHLDRRDRRDGGSSNQIVSTVQVANDLIGRLVGKKGAHIRHIEQQSNTKITISKRGEFYRGTENRIITIFADTEHQQQNVQRMIQEAISDPEISKRSSQNNQIGDGSEAIDRLRNNGNRLSGDQLMSRCMHVGPGSTIPDMYVVPVPDSCIGSIMGMKGVNLKKMREQTGTSIEISKRNHFFPNSQDRILVIKGDPSQISKCYELIMDSVSNPTQVNERNHLQHFLQRHPINTNGRVQPLIPTPLSQTMPMPLAVPMYGHHRHHGGPPPLQSHYHQPQPLHRPQQQLHADFPTQQSDYRRESTLQQQSSNFVANGGGFGAIGGSSSFFGTGY